MNRVTREFSRLLDREPLEEELHRFLFRHTYLLSGLGAMGRNPLVFSKPSFGSNFKADFALTGFGNYQVWTFVEIERSAHRLFTREGLPSQALSKAIAQVNSWWIWSHDYNEYAGAEFPKLTGDFDAVIVIGRRTSLSPLDVRRLQHLNATQLAGKLRVLTYDVLLDRIRDTPQADLSRLAAEHRKMTRYGTIREWQAREEEEIRRSNEQWLRRITRRKLGRSA